VLIYRVKPGRDERVGRDRTDRTGQFGSQAVPQAGERYYAKAPKSIKANVGACRPAKSKSVHAG
jgi:hypothetical protein